MPRLLLLFAALAGAYVFLNDANPRMMSRDLGLALPSGGGSMNPVMGGMAVGVGAGAVGLAGRAGG